MEIPQLARRLRVVVRLDAAPEEDVDARDQVELEDQPRGVHFHHVAVRPPVAALLHGGGHHAAEDRVDQRRHDAEDGGDDAEALRDAEPAVVVGPAEEGAERAAARPRHGADQHRKLEQGEGEGDEPELAVHLVGLLHEEGVGEGGGDAEDDEGYRDSGDVSDEARFFRLRLILRPISTSRQKKRSNCNLIDKINLSLITEITNLRTRGEAKTLNTVESKLPFRLGPAFLYTDHPPKKKRATEAAKIAGKPKRKVHEDMTAIMIVPIR